MTARTTTASPAENLVRYHRDTSRICTAVAAILGAVTYSAFLLAPWLHSRLPLTTSFPSEIEATGQPYGGWFRLSDAVSGVLIVVAVAGLFRLGELSRRDWPGGALMSLAGAASITDATTTMSCAPSLSSACRAKDATVTGLLGQTLQAHTLSGLIGFLGAALGMVLMGTALRRRVRGWGTASVAVGFALGAIGLIDLGLLVAHGPFGVAERVRDATISVWLLGLAGFVLSAFARGHRLDAAGSRFGPRPNHFIAERPAGEPPPGATAGRPRATASDPGRRGPTR
jgi:hypothetical protein